MRILILVGLLLAILAAVFYFAHLAGEALILLIIASILCIGIGILTGN